MKVICHINRPEKKNYMIITTDAEKNGKFNTILKNTVGNLGIRSTANMLHHGETPNSFH
jgi:hypothetical protein